MPLEKDLFAKLIAPPADARRHDQFFHRFRQELTRHIKHQSTDAPATCAAAERTALLGFARDDPALLERLHGFAAELDPAIDRRMVGLKTGWG